LDGVPVVGGARAVPGHHVEGDGLLDDRHPGLVDVGVRVVDLVLGLTVAPGTTARGEQRGGNGSSAEAERGPTGDRLHGASVPVDTDGTGTVGVPCLVGVSGVCGAESVDAGPVSSPSPGVAGSAAGKTRLMHQAAASMGTLTPRTGNSPGQPLSTS